MTPEEGCSKVKAFCAATGGSVTSWGRTAKRNALVGGHPDSWHQDWLAWDVVYDTPVPLRVAQRAARHHGLKLVREHDHDHLQPEVT
jgi:Zn-dependent M28 family amino/carboxypeptidase